MMCKSGITLICYGVTLHIRPHKPIGGTDSKSLFLNGYGYFASWSNCFVTLNLSIKVTLSFICHLPEIMLFSML